MSSIEQDAMPAPGNLALDRLHRLCWHAITHASDAGDDDFAGRFEDLLRQFRSAFATEEIWMETIDHPAIKCHREQHARVLGALHHVQAEILQGDIAIGRHAIDDLLPKWLSLHIETLDSVLAVALRFDERRVRGAPDRRAAAYA